MDVNTNADALKLWFFCFVNVISTVFFNGELFFITLWQDRIDGITIQAKQFQEAGHFDADNIRKKQEAMVARYEALKEPMAARKQKLSDSLRLQQLFRDVEDEETWIREKEPIASSTNRG